MQSEKSSALKAIMSRGDLFVTADDLDHHLENCVRDVRSRNVGIEQIILGQRLYFILLESLIQRKLVAITWLHVPGGFVENIFPILHTRLVIEAVKKWRIFERVGEERFPIRMDLNCPPNSVRVITS